MKVLKFESCRLAGALGAVAAGSVGAQSADAAVIVQDYDWNIPADGNFQADIDNDSVDIFDIGPDATVGANSIKIVNFDPPHAAAFIKDAAGPVNLAFGTLIGPDSSFTAGGTGEVSLNGLNPSSNPVGNFNGSTGYIGFRFLIGGNTHFGYVGYTGTQNQASGHVFKFGYEDSPGQAIRAGAPEPTSLALLAVGAAGLGVYRRRRSA